MRQAEDLLKGSHRAAKGAPRALGCRANDEESTLDLRLSGTDPKSIAQEAAVAMGLLTDRARRALGLPALQPGRTEVSPRPEPSRRPDPTKRPGGSASDSDSSENTG